jgi:hypothetical protein
MSIVELIHAGNMSPRLAALLWVGMERGASIIVASMPQASGKTTTLTALLDFLPESAGLYFTRGMGETFDLPPAGESQPMYILVNEISNHTPVYTWGQYAQRAFDLTTEGYSLGSTMHAEKPEQVAWILNQQLNIPEAQIANVTFIMTMYLLRNEGQLIRRVAELSFQQLNENSELTMTIIAAWDPHEDAFHVLEFPEQVELMARWADMQPAELTKELEQREAVLAKLLAEGAADGAKVSAAVAAYYKQHGRI